MIKGTLDTAETATTRTPPQRQNTGLLLITVRVIWQQQIKVQAYLSTIDNVFDKWYRTDLIFMFNNPASVNHYSIGQASHYTVLACEAP